MIELKGRYNKDCKILIDEVENEALALIQAILDQPASEGVPIRIQCDTHAGKGIVIGFTMPLTQLLNPAWVGCDVGCGMISAKFTSEKELNLEEIDNSIRKVVPMGFNLNSASIVKNIPFERAQETADKFVKKFNEKFGTSHIAPTYNEKWLMKMLKDIDMDVTKFYSAIGSLGSGNHFIELGKDSKDNYWITIHSGSRNFGLKVFDYWMNVANGKVKVVSDEYNKELDYILQNTYPKSDIPKKMKELKDKYKVGINKEYLSDENLIGYLFFMIFAQMYAQLNREVMLNSIKEAIGVKRFDEIVNTIHNYVDFNDLIIRKGAISSYLGQKMIIPLNMRDGILLCEGKSNSDFNFSGPHGSGRLMSRSAAKSSINFDKFRKSMEGIYSTSVTRDTLDESPMAYKSSELIESLIEPTATILDRIKPILNIKDLGKAESWKERKNAKKKRDKERELNRDAFRKMKRRG